MDRLLEQELDYPAVALEAGIKGEVIVAVRLDPTGKVLERKLARSLSPECDAEALRLAGLLLWKPATAGEACSGKEVHIAVPFDPVKQKRWLKSRHKREGEVWALPVDSVLDVFSAKHLDRQVAPEIQGGMSGLPTYLARELRYPPEAYRYSLDGTVTLEFVVEASGNLSNMHALQEVGGGCLEEAMRLMHRIAWNPGLRHGKRVRSTMQVSIRFTLPKEAR
ncbi:MAG: TonB family protein [Flavobacteriales bacterium]|nr:TonB family protein [Flavobacteriales bacterium]